MNDLHIALIGIALTLMVTYFARRLEKRIAGDQTINPDADALANALQMVRAAEAKSAVTILWVVWFILVGVFMFTDSCRAATSDETFYDTFSEQRPPIVITLSGKESKLAATECYLRLTIGRVLDAFQQDQPDLTRGKLLREIDAGKHEDIVFGMGVIVTKIIEISESNATDVGFVLDVSEIYKEILPLSKTYVVDVIGCFQQHMRISIK